MPSDKFRMVMKTGPNPGKVFELTMESMSVGREAGNDIVIQDAELSRNHARISRRGGAFVLEDLGSTNGTFVNGQRVMSPRSLAPGDEVGFGENVVVTFQGEGAAATVAAAGRQPPTRQPAPPPPRYDAAPPQYAAPQPAKAGGGSQTLIIGCGVLVVLCIVFAIVAYIFDSYNNTGLYCVAPFKTFFNILYSILGWQQCP
jgi:predicted component of type VI protein secretion system